MLQINQGLNITQSDLDEFRNSAQQGCPNYQNYGAALPQGITPTGGAAAAVSARDLD